MFAHSRGLFGSFEGAGCRRAGLAAASAAVVALAVASAASAATTFVHSAKSGELGGGRLTLHGVHGQVTWISDSGHSGRVSVRRLHRRGFASRNPAATGVLHVAGHRGGDEPTFKLSTPRHDRARDTVSYRAKPLNKRRLPGGAARAAAVQQSRRFGTASLSMVPGPQVASGDGGGQDCHGKFGNGATFPLVADGDKWPTDSWVTDPTNDLLYGQQGEASLATWESEGGTLEGCSNTVTWSWIDGSVPPADAPLTVQITTYVKWDGSDHTNSCNITSGADKYKCVDDGAQSPGNSAYIVVPR
jgi:hypothetical protein